MRWTLPECGTARLRLRFFWWPVRVKGTIYWLEFRTVREEWWRRSDGVPTLPFCDHCRWLVVEVFE